VSSLFVSIDYEFLVNNETLAFTNILDKDLGGVLRQNITDTMVFQLTISHGDEEGVFLVDEEPIEDEHRVCHSLALITDALVEFKRSDDRDECLE